MAGFVGCDAEGGEAFAVEVFAAEGEAFFNGMIVVGEVAADFDDFNVVDAGITHDGGCGFGAGEARVGGDFGPL